MIRISFSPGGCRRRSAERSPRGRQEPLDRCQHSGMRAGRNVAGASPANRSYARLVHEVGAGCPARSASARTGTGSPPASSPSMTRIRRTSAGRRPRRRIRRPVAQDAEFDQSVHVLRSAPRARSASTRGRSCSMARQRGPSQTAASTARTRPPRKSSADGPSPQSRGVSMDPAGRRRLRRRRPACDRSARAARCAPRAVSRADSDHRASPRSHRPRSDRRTRSVDPPVTGRDGVERPIPDRPDRGRADRPGHQLPGDTDLHGPDRGQGGPGRDQRSVQGASSSSPARPMRSSRPSASPGRPTARDSSWPPDEAALAADLTKNGKRLAFLRADAVGPEVRALDWGDTALFGVDRVKDLAAWPLTRTTAGRRRRHRLRPDDDLDAVRRRRHHAGPRRVRDPARQGQGRRLPVRRRDGRHHRPLQGLLAARLGPAVHQADRQRRRVPLPDQGCRHRHRQLREPGPERPEVAHQGHGLLGRSAAHRRAGAGRHRLRLAGQQPHPRRRRERPPPDHHERQEARHRGRRARARTSRRRASRRSSPRPGRRSPSSATTRSPAATTRRPPRSAAPR